MNPVCSADFPACGFTGLSSPVDQERATGKSPNPQARKPALRTRLGSWSQCAASKSCRLPMNRCSVAQVANLPYRRLLIGEVLERRTASGLATRDTAQRGQAATNTIQPRMNTDKRNAVFIRVNPCPSVVKKIFAGCDDFGRY